MIPRLLLGLVLVACGLAACGQSHSRSAANTLPAPGSSSGLTGAGILLVKCGDDESLELTIFDATTGNKIANRRYPAAAAHAAAVSRRFTNFACPGADRGRTLEIREAFSPDLTKVAATQTNHADGSTQAGYYDLASGRWTAAPALPSNGSGFGATASSETEPLFSPTTGNLWFRSGQDIYSVKPGTDTIQDRQSLPWLVVSGDPLLGARSTAPPFLLAANDAPVRNNSLLPNPSGTMAVDYNSGNYSPPEENHLYTAQEMRDVAAGGRPLLNTDCQPLTWVSDTKFICPGPEVADASNPEAGSLVPLLPTSQRATGSFVANPQNHNVAFLSLQDQTLSLFVTDAEAPGSQPRKVVDIMTGASDSFFQGFTGGGGSFNLLSWKS